jgi:magnesium chelatase family protein
VVAARERQRCRFVGQPGIHCNADMRSRDLADFCRLTTAGQERMRHLLQQLDLSARAYDRVLKVARTVADLAGADDVSEEHVLEASTWRELDRAYWI